MNITKLIDNLVQTGFYYEAHAFDQSLVTQLREECNNRILTKASIGNTHKHISNEIRNDNISWLSNDESNCAVQTYQQNLHDVMRILNQELFLGLNSVETHFAKYDAGSFYKKHKDSFKEHNQRVITFITYLNDKWTPDDGGMLRVYSEKGFHDVAPTEGSIVCFVSEQVEHEVLISNAPRYSLTGWFRRD